MTKTPDPVDDNDVPLAPVEQLLDAGPEAAVERMEAAFLDKIAVCDRLGCGRESTLICPQCWAAYCDVHPPIEDHNPSTCDACGFDFDLPEPEPEPPIITPEGIGETFHGLPGQVVAGEDEQQGDKPAKKSRLRRKKETNDG